MVSDRNAAAADVMLSVSLAEYDTNGDSLIAWSYPSTESAVDEHVLKRAKILMEGKENRLAWTRTQNSWCYLLPIVVNPKQSAVRHLRGFTIFVQSKQFDPERFEALAEALAQAYASKGTPLAILEAYLSVFTVGKFQSYVDSSFQSASPLAASPLKAVVEALGEGAVQLWTAIVLKKRVVVHSDDLRALQSVLRALPALAWHRQDWTILRPFCLGDEEESEGAASGGFFCAGYLEPQAGGEGGLWDVYVDLPAREVVVAEQSAKDFGVTSVHRDLGRVLSGAADVSDEELIKAVAEKTEELLAKLQVLVDEEEGEGLTLSSLTEQLPNAALANFLFGVALAEGLARTD